jgi:hypothetical protein
MNQTRLQELKDLLESKHKWPDVYLFKFIIIPEQEAELKEMMGNCIKVTQNKSKTGKYVSFTFHKLINSSDEVLSFYKKASTIKGLFSL